MARKKYSNPFEYVDGLQKNKPFATISEKQAKNLNFQNLSGDAVKLLVYLKLSRKYYTGTDKDGNGKAIDGDCLYFHWNRALAQRNGFKNPNKTLRAMRELVSNGFVEVIENNKYRRTKNLFRFSAQWQNESETIKLTEASRTYLCNEKTKQRES